jgi:Flp pilus assembly protein TadG
MTRRLGRDGRATATLEFALVAPAMLTLFMGSVAIALALWDLFALRTVSEQAARCGAVGSSTCATVTTGCDSASPIVCYVETSAATLGVASVTAGDVAVTTATLGGTTFTHVTIQYPFGILGYSFTLSAVAYYPQNTISWGASPASS